MRTTLLLFVTFLVLIPTLATAQNRSPVADAGPDLGVLVGDFVQLQGSATDPDNDDIIDWLWTVESQPAGSNPQFDNPNRPDPTFDTDTVGDYVLSLVAFDGTDWSLPDTMVVTAIQIFPPVAVATATPTMGAAPLTVQFDGSQSTVDSVFGGTIFYDWNFGDQTVGSNEVSPVHTYTEPGTYVAILRVFDDLGQFDSDAVTINVGTTPTKPSTWGRIKALYR
jgi:hypothetical protein